MAMARAKVVLFELVLVTLFEIAPPLPLSGEFFDFSQERLEARRFRRFLMYAFSGFAISLMVEEDDASVRLANDFDLPL